ncbi:MAG: hypothetical protein VW547_15225 [Alphaproteobacteria bacterium]
MTITILGRREPVVGEAIAHDHETGFGMVLALAPLDLPPLPIGSASQLSAGDDVVVSGSGGFDQAIVAELTARQPFAGPWE